MKTLWIFRTNLTTLEDYHLFSNIEDFKNRCWDFYLNMGLNFLENDYFDKVIIWRLRDKKNNVPAFDSIKFKFKVNSKKSFIQKWVDNFDEVFNYPKPDVTFFRGGFPEYDELTKKNPKFFGLKLYLAAGKRLTPQFGGIYDKILIEDEKDKLNDNFIPFYKTTCLNIFKPEYLDKKYDLCIISNFTQMRYKGTDLIIKELSKQDSFLNNLKICHVGNKSNIGLDLCKKYNVKNISFIGHLAREGVNTILNQSRFGIVNSNRNDGCPRVITEVLTSGTPLFINEKTRVLPYYKEYGVVEFSDLNLTKKLIEGFKNYNQIKKELNDNLDRFSMNKICEMNYKNWT